MCFYQQILSIQWTDLKSIRENKWLVEPVTRIKQKTANIYGTLNEKNMYLTEEKWASYLFNGNVYGWQNKIKLWYKKKSKVSCSNKRLPERT